MSDVSQWNTSAASNNSAPPDGFPEGQAPSTVNDSAREVMASVARWYSDSDGSLQTGGSGNTYTLTTNSTHAALADIPLLTFRVDRANTGSATLNVDSLGAKDLRMGGAAVSSGDLIADTILSVAYNATDDAFDIVNTLTAAQMRTRLGLVIGTDVQSWDVNLDQIAALSVANSNFIVGNGSAWVAESAATARASLGVAIGVNVQAWDVNLDQIAALAVTDGNIIVGNGSAWVAESGATARTSLGLGSAATEADTKYSHRSNNLSDLASASTARTNLGLGSLATASNVNNGNWSGTDLAVTNGGTGSSTAAGAATNLGLGTGNSPQFTAVNVGHATDTTVSRVAAGQIGVEGDAVFSHASGTYSSAKITFQSGGSPSGGSDGDIVLIY